MNRILGRVTIFKKPNAIHVYILSRWCSQRCVESAFERDVVQHMCVHVRIFLLV